MVNAVPARLPVKLRVSCTVTIVVWSLRPVGPEIIAPCVNVIIPIPLFKWSSWSACVAAAVETATTGIRKASSIAIAQILNFIFILQLVGYFYHCAPPRRSNEQRNSVVPWRNKGDAIHGELLTAGFLESDYLIPSLQEVIESAHRMARATLVYPSVKIKRASASC